MKLTLSTAIDIVRSETISVAEAASALKFTRQGVLSLVNRKALDAARIGSQLRVTRESVDRYAEKGKTDGNS